MWKRGGGGGGGKVVPALCERVDTNKPLNHK